MPIKIDNINHTHLSSLTYYKCWAECGSSILTLKVYGPIFKVLQIEGSILFAELDHDSKKNYLQLTYI